MVEFKFSDVFRMFVIACDHCKCVFAVPKVDAVHVNTMRRMFYERNDSIYCRSCISRTVELRR